MSESNDRWLNRERTVLANCTLRQHDPSFGPVFVRGEGSRLWDAGGREFLDLTCGYSATNFGHAFPPLIDAAAKQLSTLTHLTQQPHPGRALLAEKLLQVCGFSGTGKVLFNVTGSRAVESAWKACYNFRPGRLVTIGNAYHGRSIATSVLSDTLRSLESPLCSELVERRSSRDYAYCAACPWELRYPSCNLRCSDRLIADLREHAQDISALLVEPALGARGYIFPPAEYWLSLRSVTRELGILMIADEIQMGLGRCGDWLLSTAQNWQADLVVLGKSLGGGITPISAVVGRAEVLDSIPAGSESETFAATPISAAIALEVIRQLQDGPWIERGRYVGATLRAKVHSLLDRNPITVRIEGLGACAAIEFIDSTKTTTQAADYCFQLARACLDAGLLVHRSGPMGTRIVLIPALTITDDELADALARFESAFRAITIGSSNLPLTNFVARHSTIQPLE